jgi:ketosteroid isomerase-like protein
VRGADPANDLEHLIARERCREVVVASVRAVDEQAYARLATLFTGDGVLVRPGGQTLQGRDAIAQAYGQRDRDRLTRHLLSTHTLEWRADGTMHSRCDVLLWTGKHSDPVTNKGRPADTLQQVGCLDDELVNTAEGWRIRRRVATFLLHRG